MKHHQQTARQRNTVPSDLSTKDLPFLLNELEKNPAMFFKDSQQSIDKSLLLYYLNSGYEMYDQYKEYDANAADCNIDKAKIIADIRSQKLSNQELQSKLQSFYSQHSYTNANLISCGSCGVRLKERTAAPVIKFERLYLKDPKSSILQYNDEQLWNYELEKQMDPVSIPIDALFTEKKIHPYQVKSVYKSKEDFGTFHLHPELVEIDEDSNESTLLCPICWKAIEKEEIPELSIAAGIDFGYYQCLGLEAPNLDEQMILSRCRLILATLKLKANCLGRVGFH